MKEQFTTFWMSLETLEDFTTRFNSSAVSLLVFSHTAVCPNDWSTSLHTLCQRSVKKPLLLPVSKGGKKSRSLIYWLPAKNCLDSKLWKASLSCCSTVRKSCFAVVNCCKSAGFSGLANVKLTEALTSCYTWEHRFNNKSCSAPSSRADSYATWPETSPNIQSCGCLRMRPVRRAAMHQSTYRGKKAYHFKTSYGKCSMVKTRERIFILTLC